MSHRHARTGPPSSLEDVEQVDVLIVGAGLSGIGAGRYLRTELPHKSFVILEGRAASGGTWDLFRYPGIRSDSDLTTFGYEFKPWREKEAIADAAQIVGYLRETATENGLDEHIRYHHRVQRASWSSETARWLVEVEQTDTGERRYFSAGWLFCAGGYYDYDEGYTPVFEGRDRFRGQVVHPQHWPEDLDYTGKKVVVIGSGATAVTLVPSMADDAAHVTMLQRTPTYVMPIPRVDKLANNLRRWFGDDRGHALARQKNIAKQRAIWLFAQRFPGKARQVIRRFNEERLPAGFPVDEHFNPPYNPWDQRLCAVPDGDLFRSIRNGDASVVTDRITTFTEDGILLESGRELEADIIVTATGLNIKLLGGIDLVVDGRAVDVSQSVAYRGVMLSGIPNLAMAIGYTNSSWTLKIGLLCDYFCRLLAHLDEHGHDAVWPVADPDMETRPLLDFGAGYVQRALDTLPKQGVAAPWLMSMNYYNDAKVLRRGAVVDEHLAFASATAPVTRERAVLAP
ncbi:NAD(P)-binding domain-containing protein [Pimelobacter simplex]|uniref:flavin-containing monooxygenase n=1 Tax=Nocardioides simplex TaxID=2045 RepID=UPI000691ADB0|nr:NAD(P)/FAD-dependent oxidoreductase [Pimelobacter simplex]MCG8149431.1 NAD(P)-binding domain-containing protein [Pimelobacter simplex]GEB16198.1 flavin-binding monooxygenase [Pimelobacter simplex]SFM19200.1 Predicted flavoprotein CzcO associated with the cation diffusion facilitator CzcD [Pimelobacter simplex]